MLFRLLAVLVFGFTVPVHWARAQDVRAPFVTDLNLITAVDVSDSISRHEEWLQYSGLARGIVDRNFLALVKSGVVKRIGFVAFTWSSHGQMRIIVPWTVISNLEDAALVSAQFKTAPRIDRSHYEICHRCVDNFQDLAVSSHGGMTDIAQSITTAARLAADAPYQGGRTVINILSDGVDNVGFDPILSRDAAVRQGATINGVVFGGNSDLHAYFRQNVIGGPGAFLVTVRDPSDLPKALEKKFWRDLISRYAVSSATG